MGAELLLAVDIGGTKLAVGVAEAERFASSGALDHVHKELTPAPATPQVVIPRVIALARELAARAGGPIGRIGISIGGPLDHLSGTVINFPHLPDWIDIPLCAELSAALDAPALLDNDANLGALAEQRWGAGRGVSDMVYITVSTGIGGGVIVGGQLVHGVGSSAGEIGHITVDPRGPECPCGNVGCLEALASGTAIAGRAAEALAAEPQRASVLRQLPAKPSAKDVFEAAQRGDALAQQLWEETVSYLALGLGGIIHVLAPQLIVIGGGVAQAGAGLLDPLRSALRRHVFYVPLERVQITAAALGHDSALLGAATLALQAGS